MTSNRSHKATKEAVYACVIVRFISTSIHPRPLPASEAVFKIPVPEHPRAGHVDSITVFSKCHHGWAYHPSEANEMHPHLSFDLLGEMIVAAHEIDVKTPVYLSAGLDESWRGAIPNG